MVINYTTIKVKSKKKFSPTMFQGMVFFTTLENENICLKTIYKNIVSYHKKKLHLTTDNKKIYDIEVDCKNDIKIHPPGSLGINMTKEQVNDYQIGTIDCKFTLNSSQKKISVLLFKDKMKISGGFEHDCNLETDYDMNQYIFEIGILVINLFNMKIHRDSMNVKISLINGYMCLGYQIPNFSNFCLDHLYSNKLFDRVVMPSYDNSKRGRIGTVRLYPFETLNSSAQFDRLGAVQFFGFRSIEDLILFANILETLINNTYKHL